MRASSPETRLSSRRPFLVLEVHAREAGVSKAPHSHPEGQLYVVNSGLFLVETAAGTWIMPPGRVGWIPPGVEHGSRLHGTGKKGAPTGWTMYLHPDHCQGLPTVPMVLRMNGLLSALVARLTTWSSASRALTAEETRLLGVFRDELRAAPEEPLRLPMPRDPRLVSLAVALANAPEDEATLADWAPRLGMSRRSLTRHFRAETGMSFVQWRQLARLKRGLEMLADGESVTATALTLGYDSVSSFIALFRRTLGTTPARHASQSVPPSAILEPPCSPR